MSSNELMLEFIESFGPQLFELKGSLSLWLAIIQTSNPISVNRLLKMIEDMDSLQRYSLAKLILEVGFDCVDLMSYPNKEEDNSGEETEIEDIVYESDDQISDGINLLDKFKDKRDDQMSECSTKSYATALDVNDLMSDHNSDTETVICDERTTRSLDNFEDDSNDTLSYDSDVSQRSNESDGSLSGHILSLSTITSFGTQPISQTNITSDDSDNSFE